MNKTQQKAFIATVTSGISAVLAQAFADMIDGDRDTHVRDTKPSPKLTRSATGTKSAPTQTRSLGHHEDVDPDLVELFVSPTAGDKRIKFPARLFDARGTAFVNGVKYSNASSTDAGRVKLQPSVFDADRGDTIRIMRDAPRSNKWTAVVVGAKKTGTRKSAPETIVPSKKQPRIKGQGQPKGDTVKLSQIIADTAAQAIANANKRGFEPNANLSETDARRFLTSRQKKAFNVGTNACKVKLADAVAMLNAEVFE